MQNSDSVTRGLHLSKKLAGTWNRLRAIRKNNHTSFDSSGEGKTDILYSPFRSQHPIPYESDPDHPPLSSVSMEQIVKINEEASNIFARSVGPAMDGAGDKRLGMSRSPQVAAVFVHAGAGYHSTTNEHIHLSACKDAAKIGMSVLKNGDSAVAAVEAAIRALEDKEITNAGYGSNLTIEGVVECDATIVDHLGRSGACGATAQIKNPIHLARVILETSSRPLSLRRVPPNLLVGEGATTFAYEHDISIVPYDALVSRSARERFLRWRDDLKRAGRAQVTPGTPKSHNSNSDQETIDLEYEERVRHKQRRDHTNAMLTGTWNEGQPDSPQSQSPIPITSEFSWYDSQSPKSTETRAGTPPSEDKLLLSSLSPLRPMSRSPSTQSSRDGSSPTKRPRHGAFRSSDGQARVHSLLGTTSEELKTGPDPNMASVDLTAVYSTFQKEGNDGSTSPTDNDKSIPVNSFSSPSQETTPRAIPTHFDEDLITDTVGAIAIDSFGNIAAGSSSGGIGMKHRGRVGPAALVGIGTTVIPVDPVDPDRITVAAVTSGTGEHMATTMASQKCAERLYFCNRRGSAGVNKAATEEEAMHSFVEIDFMDHPGVKNGHSGGAIGVMAVKKTPYGYFLHFAHNTDSFALASIHSNEKEPKCVMSRIGDHSNVVQGGRKIRLN